MGQIARGTPMYGNTMPHEVIMATQRLDARLDHEHRRKLDELAALWREYR